MFISKGSTSNNGGVPYHLNLHNCCIVTLARMSAGQTTCLTSAIPCLLSLFRLCTAGLKKRLCTAGLKKRFCTAGLKNLMRVTINNINALIHSTAQQVGLRTFWDSLIVYLLVTAQIVYN